LTNLAVLPQGTNADIVATNIGNAFISRSPEQFRYDVDGNLTNDGRWAYTWDAENRLVRMLSLSTTPSNSWRALSFAYDPQSRRISKVVSNWNGAAWTLVLSNKFLYDGWNLIAEVNGSNNTVIRSYAWGIDPGGTLQGAGGVGGLLMAKDSSGGNHFVAYDGNGNVAALVSATNGTASAQYEYGPFGEVIRATGPMARANPLRWSTQYTDDETDLVCYAYRHYGPATGRWLSRDPYDENNAYVFVENNGVNRYDVLGLWGPSVHYGLTVTWASQVGVDPTQSHNIGVADNGIDAVYDVGGILSPIRNDNWSWHFNRSLGSDSRLQHRAEEVTKAKQYCSQTTDDPYTAAAFLGRALHPDQDWVAHGDFNRVREEPSLTGYLYLEKEFYIHNFDALSHTVGLYGPGDPDNPEMDANGPEGRATIETLKPGHHFWNNDQAYWTGFHGGHRRITLTERRTKSLLADFQGHVRANAKRCGQCWKAFVGER
jgi:RHS repeat-associated protein